MSTHWDWFWFGMTMGIVAMGSLVRLQLWFAERKIQRHEEPWQQQLRIWSKRRWH